MNIFLLLPNVHIMISASLNILFWNPPVFQHNNKRNIKVEENLGQKNLGQKNLGQKNLGQKNLGQKNLGQKNLGQKSERSHTSHTHIF